jgi:hypothetical protein
MVYNKLKYEIENHHFELHSENTQPNKQKVKANFLNNVLLVQMKLHFSMSKFALFSISNH